MFTSDDLGVHDLNRIAHRIGIEQFGSLRAGDTAANGRKESCTPKVMSKDIKVLNFFPTNGPIPKPRL